MPTLPVVQAAIARKRSGRVRERLDAHVALQPLRTDNDGEQNVAGLSRHGLRRRGVFGRRRC